MKKILIFIIFTIFIFFKFKNLFANNYKEIDSILKLGSYLNNDINSTLIIFRLDNTLIRLEQMLGSIEWFENRKNHLLKSLTYEKTIKQVLLEWLTIQNLTKCKLVDENISYFLKNLQNLGYKILIITERPFYLIKATQSQLEQLNINSFFNNSQERPYIIKNFSNNENYNECLPIILQNGVLFTSGIINKITFSSALSLLFKQQSFFPKNIVYIDQNENYIKEVDLFSRKEMINFTGVRFSRADKEINNFDNKIAEIQLNYLQSFFSLKTLEMLINNNRN